MSTTTTTATTTTVSHITTHTVHTYVHHTIPSCKILTRLECCFSVLMEVGARIEPSGHKVQVESGDIEVLPVILEGKVYV